MAGDSAATVTSARRFFHASIGSTNAEALALLRAGDMGPLWIVAGEQTAGRGRRGRSWQSPPGNFYASLLLPEPCAPAAAAQLSFVAVMALRDAVGDAAPAARAALQVKWPNDLLLAGAKLAGILVEGERTPNGGFAAVIGFGVNCVAHPAGTTYPATNLAQAGFSVGPEMLLDALAVAVERRLAQWRGGSGFALLREDWQAIAAGLGESVRLAVGASQIEGRFDGIDGEGRLVLVLADASRRSFASGELAPGAVLTAAAAASERG